MQNKKMIIGVGIALLVISLIGTGIFYNSSRSLSNDLTQEKKNTQQLSSDKAQVEKDLFTYKECVRDMTGQINELNTRLTDANLKLDEAISQNKELATDAKTIESLRKQLAEIKQAKQVAEDNAAYQMKRYDSDNSALTATNESLKAINKELANNLELLRAVSADNFRLETTKNKNKLTVFARRTKEMKVSFEMPQTVEADIKFEITDPKGKLISGSGKEISYVITNSKDASLTAGTENVGAIVKQTKKVEMTYKPKVKLQPGIYTIEMLNKDQHIANCQVKLR